MNTKIFASILLVFLFASNAEAALGKVTISSPQSGTTIAPTQKVTLNYEANLSPTGDHLHLSVDGKTLDVIHKLKGTTEVSKLSPGKHRVCLLENTKGHTATGTEGCIEVFVK